MCQNMCKAANDQNDQKQHFQGLANKVPVKECARVFCVCQSVSPGPGALSSLPQPSPADSNQVRAQEPCPAVQRFRESAYHSGSFPEKLQGPGVLVSVQGCSQVKPRPCAPPAHRNCAQDGKPHVSRHCKNSKLNTYLFYLTFKKLKSHFSCFYICVTGSQSY